MYFHFPEGYAALPLLVAVFLKLSVFLKAFSMYSLSVEFL